MRRIPLGAILAVLVLLWLAACRGGGDQGETQMQQTTGQEEAATQEGMLETEPTRISIVAPCATEPDSAHVEQGGSIIWSNTMDDTVRVVTPMDVCDGPGATLVLAPGESDTCTVNARVGAHPYRVTCPPGAELTAGSPVIIVDPPTEN